MQDGTRAAAFHPGRWSLVTGDARALTVAAQRALPHHQHLPEFAESVVSI